MNLTATLYSIRKQVKNSLCGLLLICFGCTHQPKMPAVHVTLVDSNQSVKFKGLDYAIVSEINRDSTTGIWQRLLPVYRMPADTDLKDYQPVQPGVYRLKDSAVVFTPDTPFAKSRTYFMRYYKFGDANGVWDFIRNKKRLGSMHYVDLEFKL